MQGYRVWLLPIIVMILLTACNLSSTTSPSSEVPSPSPVQTQNLSATNNAIELTTQPQVESVASQNTVQNTTQNVSNQSDTVSSSAAEDVYWVQLPWPTSACSVSPIGDYTVNIRTSPDTNAQVVGVLAKQSWVQVSKFVNNWYQVNYPGSPVNAMWISSDPVVLNQPCHCDVAGCSDIRNPSNTSPQNGVPVVGFSGEGPACSVGGYGEYTVNIRQNAYADAPIVGKLATGMWINVARYVNGWYQITYPGSPVDGMWISGDPVELQQPCSCGLSCVQTESLVMDDLPDFTGCTAINKTSDVQWIYSEGGLTRLDNPQMGDLMARFHPGVDMPITGQRDQYYQVYVGALNNTGWVDKSLVNITGTCDNIPTK